MKKKELIEKAIELLNDSDIFCQCVEELDSWNGFADGFRCYPMYELDDLFCDCKVSDFLQKVDTDNFNLSDDFFIDTIYGLQSTDDAYSTYMDYTDAGEVLDNLIDCYFDITLRWIDAELDEVVEQLAEADFEEE